MNDINHGTKHLKHTEGNTVSNLHFYYNAEGKPAMVKYFGTMASLLMKMIKVLPLVLHILIICIGQVSAECIDYSDDFYIAFQDKDLWGVMDKNGKTVIEPMYDRIFDFRCDKYANVWLRDGKHAIITPENDYVVGPTNDHIVGGESDVYFGGEDGYYAVLNEDEDTEGYFDIRYQHYEPPTWSSIIYPLFRDRENLLLVNAAVGVEDRYGFIDSSNGDVIIPCIYADLSFFGNSEYTTGTKILNGKETGVIIKRNGEETDIKDATLELENYGFRNNMAMVYRRNSETEECFGFIDTNGYLIVETTLSFAEGWDIFFEMQD